MHVNSNQRQQCFTTVFGSNPVQFKLSKILIFASMYVFYDLISVNFKKINYSGTLYFY